MQVSSNHIINLVIILTLVFLVAGGYLLMYIALYNNRKKKHLEEKKYLHANHEQELLNARLEMQEETFQHISQEIHDNIGQSLSLVKMTLYSTDSGNPIQLEEKIKQSRELVTKAILDLRQLSHSLNPEYVVAAGLPVLVEKQLEQLKKLNNYKTGFHRIGEPEKLDSLRQLAILRVIQELINNIIKHADASTINIALNYAPNEFYASISDDGCGINADIDTKKVPSGIGILSMQMRIKQLGGNIRFESGPGMGTKVEISLPYKS